MAQAVDSSSAGAPESGSKRFTMVAIVALFLVIGIGTGFFLLQRLPGAPGAAPAGVTPATLAPAATPLVAPELITLENLIVNPAGTDGSRYLVMSIAFEVRDMTTKERLEAMRVPVRDLIAGVVGGRRVDELSSVAHRDSLKRILSDTVRAFLQVPGPLPAYFPQYVLQ
jgi:flagellar FliL protein